MTMRKVICLIMAIVMCMSICAYAANETSSSTHVEYIGSREPSGGGEGGGDSSETVGEYYEVTVPALMNPGDTDEVWVDGYWAANRKLSVTTDTKVTMTNSDDRSTRDLNVLFESISERGSNTQQMHCTSEISVQEMNDVIFGLWSGTITYTISVSNV